MARYTGPRNKLARREGIDLGGKTVGSHAHAALLRRLNIPPGVHGAKGKRKQSEYGTQLREKQKMKRIYGVLERQFHRYFEKARKFRGNTGDMLLQLLERRLDNVIYRLGFVPTRSASRQMIAHRHISVDGQILDIPSYKVKVGQVITLSPKAVGIPVVKQALEEKTFSPPAWLERQGPAGKVARLPERDDVKEDISTQLIVEYYSR